MTVTAAIVFMWWRRVGLFHKPKDVRELAPSSEIHDMSTASGNAEIGSLEKTNRATGGT
jgi:hypothetical protein